MPVTGLRQPIRIVWVKPDGSVYRVDSIAYDKDPDEYVKEMRRIEGHKYDYYVKLE